MSPDVSNLSTMAITDQLFEAFLHCPTKCFLRAQDEPPTDSVYTDWVRQQFKSYQKTVATSLMKRLSPIGPLSASLDPVDAISASWRCAVDFNGPVATPGISSPCRRAHNLRSADEIGILGSHTVRSCQQTQQCRQVN